MILSHQIRFVVHDSLFTHFMLLVSLCCHPLSYCQLTFLNSFCSLLERTAWSLDRKLVTFLSILMQNWAVSPAILDFLPTELEN